MKKIAYLLFICSFVFVGCSDIVDLIASIGSSTIGETTVLVHDDFVGKWEIELGNQEAYKGGEVLSVLKNASLELRSSHSDFDGTSNNSFIVENEENGILVSGKFKMKKWQDVKKTTKPEWLKSNYSAPNYGDLVIQFYDYSGSKKRVWDELLDKSDGYCNIVRRKTFFDWRGYNPMDRKTGIDHNATNYPTSFVVNGVERMTGHYEIDMKPITCYKFLNEIKEGFRIPYIGEKPFYLDTAFNYFTNNQVKGNVHVYNIGYNLNQIGYGESSIKIKNDQVQINLNYSYTGAKDLYVPGVGLGHRKEIDNVEYTYTRNSNKNFETEAYTAPMRYQTVLKPDKAYLNRSYLNKDEILPAEFKISVHTIGNSQYVFVINVTIGNQGEISYTKLECKSDTFNFGQYPKFENQFELNREDKPIATLEEEVKPVEEVTLQNSEIEIKYYEINDPDGYSNLRETPAGNILRRVYLGEKFEVLDEMDRHKKVKFSNGETGYIHVSRIVESNNK